MTNAPVGQGGPSPTPAGAPSDYDTLRQVLDDLASRGWTDDAVACEGGTVKFRSCGHEAPAGDIRVDRMRRMEGASDPDDLLAVVAACCPECEAHGVLVVHYGPTAGAADADVLAALPE